MWNNELTSHVKSDLSSSTATTWIIRISLATHITCAFFILSLLARKGGSEKMLTIKCLILVSLPLFFVAPSKCFPYFLAVSETEHSNLSGVNETVEEVSPDSALNETFPANLTGIGVGELETLLFGYNQTVDPSYFNSTLNQTDTMQNRTFLESEDNLELLLFLNETAGLLPPNSTRNGSNNFNPSNLTDSESTELCKLLGILNRIEPNNLLRLTSNGTAELAPVNIEGLNPDDLEKILLAINRTLDIFSQNITNWADAFSQMNFTDVESEETYPILLGLNGTTDSSYHNCSVNDIHRKFLPNITHLQFQALKKTLNKIVVPFSSSYTSNGTMEFFRANVNEMSSEDLQEILLGFNGTKDLISSDYNESSSLFPIMDGWSSENSSAAEFASGQNSFNSSENSLTSPIDLLETTTDAGLW